MGSGVEQTIDALSLSHFRDGGVVVAGHLVTTGSFALATLALGPPAALPDGKRQVGERSDDEQQHVRPVFGRQQAEHRAVRKPEPNDGGDQPQHRVGLLVHRDADGNRCEQSHDQEVRDFAHFYLRVEVQQPI